MRVKIGDKWFDSKETPIVCEILDSEKTIISHSLYPSVYVFYDSSHTSIEDAQVLITNVIKELEQ